MISYPERHHRLNTRSTELRRLRNQACDLRRRHHAHDAVFAWSCVDSVSGATMFLRLVRKAKSFDAFPKVLPGYKQQSATGGFGTFWSSKKNSIV